MRASGVDPGPGEVTRCAIRALFRAGEDHRPLLAGLSDYPTQRLAPLPSGDGLAIHACLAKMSHFRAAYLFISKLHGIDGTER